MLYLRVKSLINPPGSGPSAAPRARQVVPQGLVAQAEFGDQRAVPVEIGALEIAQQAAALADHHQQSTAGMMDLAVLTKVTGQVKLGWQPLGGHQVSILNTIDRNGIVYYNNEYSQTMVKETHTHNDEVKLLLYTLKKDAEMALSGEWDCTTQEGIESFSDQIDLIQKVLDKLD